ncbi:hypothetical protein CDL15_Pgr022811 [Punica granatum]|uniref:Uncharacterized protein n=1 Tax=Punica granatum TaxID=22663 RepID=A0A218X3V9_PUNGR|nr:hypothetical protein CDL15_Pgr022811 [Punica granatum]
MNERYSRSVVLYEFRTLQAQKDGKGSVSLSTLVGKGSCGIPTNTFSSHLELIIDNGEGAKPWVCIVVPYRLCQERFAKLDNLFKPKETRVPGSAIVRGPHLHSSAYLFFFFKTGSYSALQPYLDLKRYSSPPFSLDLLNNLPVRAYRLPMDEEQGLQDIPNYCKNYKLLNELFNSSTATGSLCMSLTNPPRTSDDDRQVLEEFLSTSKQQQKQPINLEEGSDQSDDSVHVVEESIISES